MKFWILMYSFIVTDLYNCQNYQTQFETLAAQVAVAFNNLRSVLNTSALVSNSSNVDISQVNQTVAQSILNTTKVDTESLVNVVNGVVNDIQSRLNNNYKNNCTKPRFYTTVDCNDNNFFPYFRAKTIQNYTFSTSSSCVNQSLPFSQDPVLENILTNRMNSTTHVPTTVFDSSVAAQDIASWTQSLDDVFNLRQNEAHVKWQYFCSNTGLFKIYPGIGWNIRKEDSDANNSVIDLFDCRSEQFYLQSTSYPKKVLILLDQSGSMKGRSASVANITVNEILNTLTENDFFNILMFSTNWSYADNATRDILIQATDRNKARLLRQMQLRYNPNHRAEFDTYFEMGYNLMRNDYNKQTDKSFYNYMIMIITDGSFTYTEGNTKLDSNVRIFTYLTLEGAPERLTIASIACKNQGFATESRTLSVVKNNVQSYLNIVARKSALKPKVFNVWTGVNKMKMQPADKIKTRNLNNSFSTTTMFPSISFSTTLNGSVRITTSSPVTVSPNSTDFGTSNILIFQNKLIKLFVSASKAVYDQSNIPCNTSSSSLLGSAGVDVSVDEFIKRAPYWKIGVNAYLFGITSNGFLVFHPKFRPQYLDFMKSFYRNVDLSDVEVDVTNNYTSVSRNHTVPSRYTNQLRNELLNQNSFSIQPSVTLTTAQITDDFKTGFNVTRNYYVTSISNTPYKFGLSIPVDQTVPVYTNQRFSTIDLITFQSVFNVDYLTLSKLCDSSFFNKSQGGLAMKKYEFCYMSQDIALLQLRSPLCVLINVFTNSTLLNQCTRNSPDLGNYLNNVYNEIINTNQFPSIWSEINGSNFYIQQVFSFHHFGIIRYYNYDSLSYRSFILNHSLGIDDPLYQETVLAAKYFSNNMILVAQSLPNKVFQSNLRPSDVVFTVTTPLMINGTFLGIVGVQARYDYLLTILMGNSLCTPTETNECYIITESGVILVNNQNIMNNGIALKDANCALSESLVTNKIFGLQYLYDFQGLCPVTSITNFSRNLINPFSMLFSRAIWLISQLFLILSNVFWTSFLWLFALQEENPIYNITSPDAARHCYLKIPAIMKILNSSQYFGTVTCGSCISSWFIRSIYNTNLFILVLIKPNTNCPCNCSSNFGATFELTRNTSNPISNATALSPALFWSSEVVNIMDNDTICSNNAEAFKNPAKLLMIVLIILINDQMKFITLF